MGQGEQQTPRQDDFVFGKPVVAMNSGKRGAVRDPLARASPEDSGGREVFRANGRQRPGVSERERVGSFLWLTILGSVESPVVDLMKAPEQLAELT